MSQITVRGYVMSVNERDAKGLHILNAILSELDGNHVAYQVVFWNEEAFKALPSVVEGNIITVTGRISKISYDKRFGAKIELAQCELLSYETMQMTMVSKNEVEDVTSLLEEKGENAK